MKAEKLASAIVSADSIISKEPINVPLPHDLVEGQQYAIAMTMERPTRRMIRIMTARISTGRQRIWEPVG